MVRGDPERGSGVRLKGGREENEDQEEGKKHMDAGKRWEGRSLAEKQRQKEKEKEGE